MGTPLPNDSFKASNSPPVGGRLRSFSRNWQANNCSSNVLNIITNGYVLPFLSKPNLVRFPLIISEYKALPKDQALANCIQSVKLLSKNAIERVENVKSLGFYSRLFLVPKPHRRWRPVIDLSRLNTFLHVEKFKMETPFDPTIGEEGVGTPLPNDSLKASNSPPVGGRLRSFSRNWQANNCSSNVLNIITNGYVLPFLSKPNLVRFPLIISEYKALPKDQALANCIQSVKLLSKNAIERVENVKSLGFYSRLFLVPKPHRRWRPVIDLSRLNTFLHVEKFKMETPESIRTSLIPGEWAASIDLSDAYLHIPIHPHSRKYLRFCHRSQVFQFTSLPFGLATAPQVFTMIVKEVKLMALSKGLRLHQYLDDWLIRSQSREEALVNTQAVVDLTQSLGWIINQQKSELNPTQVFSFVGYECHLDSALVKPTQARWLKLQDFILQLKSKHVLTARCLMSQIGLLASTEKMVPEGLLHMRPFQFHLKEHWKFPQPLDSLLPWTEAISAHLDWWQNPANVMKGADLHPKDHSIQLFTDASNEGWGAHLEQSSTQGLWSPQEKGLHINVLELKAVFLALRHFKDQCQ